MSLTDDERAVTTIYGEAANQPHEGRVAVGNVILNRLHLPYASDGTMAGVTLHKWAFSEYWSGFTHARYQQIAFDLAQAEALMEADFARWSVLPAWSDCQLAWEDAQAWFAGTPMSFPPGPAFGHLTRRTVLYYNPRIVTTPPAWAIPANMDAVIFDETFYHDG